MKYGYIILVLLALITLYLVFKEYKNNQEKKKKINVKSYCPKCGAALFEVAEFCPKCGNRLKEKDNKKEVEPVVEDNGTEFFIPQSEAITQSLDECDKSSLILQVNVNSMISEVEIETFPCLIGRLEGECGLLIEEPAVGRRHAKLEYENSKYWLTDLNSNNGTYINGVRIEPNKKYSIKENDTLKIGRAVITICGLK